MSNYINNLKSKPDEVKKQIIVVALIICMSLVVFVWLLTLGPEKDKSVKEEEKIEEGKSPFSLLIDSLKGTVKDIKTSIDSAGISEMKKDLTEQGKVIQSDDEINSQAEELDTTNNINNNEQ